MAITRMPIAPLVALLVLVMAAQHARAARQLLSKCAPLWAQCGGLNWQGPFCCEPRSVCVAQKGNDYYSQCLPDTSPKPAPSPPTPSPPPPPQGCVALYGQCGGYGYPGPTCCSTPGSSCKPFGKYYSQCQPDQPPSPGPDCPMYAQCGGVGYSGSTCCPTGSSCKGLDPFYSQCRPDDPTPPPPPPPSPTKGCAKLYEQCGGIGWVGPYCCVEGSCVVSDAYYSQCRP